MNLEPGQLVLCVFEFKAEPGEGQVPSRGVVYTVRDLEFRSWDGQVGIRLEEIHNPPLNYFDGYGERAYDVRGFRPIDRRRLGIFRSLLKEEEMA